MTPALGARALAVVLVLVLVLVSPALAVEGDPAPKIDAKEWVGKPLEWKHVRGKVVIVLFVRPRDKDSETALRDLDETLKMKEKAKEALEALLVTVAPKAEADVWARTVVRGRTWRIASDPDSRVAVAFMAQSDPHVTVVDRDGKIRFEGHALRERLAISKAVDTSLAKPPTLTKQQTSARFAAAWKALDGKAKDWAAAVREVLAIRSDPKVTPEDAADAYVFLLMAEKEADRLLADADKFRRAEEWAEALAALERAAAGFAGLPQGGKAADEASAIKGDKKLKRELDAGAILMEARALEKEGKRAEALAKYESAGARFGGTKAGERAKKKVKELKGGG